MAVVKSLLDHPVAEWIGRIALQRLSGKALACAVNARNHLVRAQKIASISTTVSYFCATHATEEAVAAFIASAKSHGYRSLAKKVNVRDHAQKAIVSAYAQMISGLVEDAGLAIAYNPAGDDLLARVKSGGETSYDPLGLGLFSFNENHEDLTSESAHLAFAGMFPNKEAMVMRVHARASSREKALYAQAGGAPDMSQEQLDINLREHTLLTLGLVWAAIDVTSHKKPTSFVLQTLGAISAVIDEVRPARLCKKCGH